jgi:uncharacterized membrane protein
LEKLLSQRVETVFARYSGVNIETSKNLGGVGALLMFISPLLGFVAPYVGLLGLVGFIMVLIALKGLGDYYSEGGIFNNALYGFMIGVIGSVVALGAFIASALATIADLGISDWMNASEWTTTLMTEAALDTIVKLIAAAVLALIILFVIVVLAAWFYRKSLNLLSTKSGVGMFGTAGLILLVGAFLTIVIIGFVLIWIAVILAAVAFFSIRSTPPTAPSPPQPP